MGAHIAKRGAELDKMLKDGSSGAVDYVRRAGIRNRRQKDIDFYSFATKYCHWHQPTSFPMFDSYVVIAVRRIDRFVCGQRTIRGDLRGYPMFVQVIDQVMDWTKWAAKAYKTADQGLWILGQILDGTLEPRDLGLEQPPKGL
jgi:hypothetical protein